MSVHDYTEGTYGHDVIFYPRAGALDGMMHGWGAGVEPGDIIIVCYHGHRVRFRISKIKYLPQAEGLWYAAVSYVPTFVEDLVIAV